MAPLVSSSVQGAVHVRRSSFCFIRRRQGCRQRALPAVSVKPESCWTGFTLGGKKAAGELLCTHRVPCSFKSTAPPPSSCPDQPTGTVTFTGAPGGPPHSSHSLSHHCSANEGLKGQSATTKRTMWDQGVPFSY
ncbi:hypothetical protein NQZ68_027948 [Dissostichus eleginoides]|nr:hypothetical protein NQZ68_027948 [Dissostichus eleginoides]